MDNELPTCSLPVTQDKLGQPIEVGSAVKSYDFPDRLGDPDRDVEACRVEGIVEGAAVLDGCSRYKIRVTRRLFAGKEVEAAAYVYPPLNGTPSWLGGATDGVYVL